MMSTPQLNRRSFVVGASRRVWRRPRPQRRFSMARTASGAGAGRLTGDQRLGGDPAR